MVAASDNGPESVSLPVGRSLDAAGGEDLEGAVHEMLTPRMSRSPAPGAGDLEKRVLGSPISRGGPRWSDLSENLSDDEDQEDGFTQETLDASPKSPSKSSRRANRRRRCREAAKAAAAESEQLKEDSLVREEPASRHVTFSGAGKMMLPAGAFVNAGFGGIPAGNCTPTCVASPVRGSPSLPAAAFSSGQMQVPGAPAEACSPCRNRTGSMEAVMSSPQAQGVIGDASTRTPTAAACASPYIRGIMTAGGCLSTTPTAAARVGAWPSASPDRSWGVLGSPGARANLPTLQSIVSTSPMASSAAVPSFHNATACGPAGSAAADTLRTILGAGGMAAGDELAAKLRAAAPETYED